MGAARPIGEAVSPATYAKVTSLTPALTPQLGLLGSPPDPVGCLAMREGPSGRIVCLPKRSIGAGHLCL
jgi:hypothetical protein